MSRFCSTCRASVDEGSQFCSQCGADLRPRSGPSVAARSDTNTRLGPTLFALIVIGVILWAMWSNSSSSAPATDAPLDPRFPDQGAYCAPDAAWLQDVADSTGVSYDDACTKWYAVNH